LGNLALRDALKDRQSRSQGVALMTSVYGATKDVETGEIRTAQTSS